MEEADKGMIDDHDGCEWVNVSSGTGSPGLSRTKFSMPIIIVSFRTTLSNVIRGSSMKIFGGPGPSSFWEATTAK